MRYQFDWDPAKALSNASKHGVAFSDVMHAFSDPLGYSIRDIDSALEEWWVTIGATSSGQVVVVVHTFLELGQDACAIRIISARRPTKSELRTYQDGDRA